LVVSPLISLMQDQVAALHAAGVAATFLNSTLSLAEANARLAALAAGAVKLVYIAPERLESARFREVLASLRVSLLAVDEAHCISLWGHDFRPSYLRLAELRRGLRCPTLALTATATPEVRRDIVAQLRLRRPVVIVRGFDRPNLAWHVLGARTGADKDRILLALLRRRPVTGVQIVYASTRKSVDWLTDLLIRAGMRAAGYHAGVPDGERRRLQDAFMAEEARIVVATNAFGMGIDKANVRRVIHYEMPASLEAYYQEAGRAGRDRAAAECVLVHAYRDRFTHEFLIEQGTPLRDVVQAVYRAARTRVGADGVLAERVVELVRHVTAARGERQVHSALRILEAAGVLRRLERGRGEPWVRLIATPERIRLELDQAAHAAERALLRALWTFAGKQLYHGVVLGRERLARLAGSADVATTTLDSLQQRGFLEWQPWPERDGWQLLVDAAPERLPVDWHALEARRLAERRKLRRMESYAYHAGCRRGFLLRYFGDPAAMRRCAACDNCLGEEGRLLPGARPPRSSLAATLRRRR
ncbi:MAG: RecQ family ATP-dependent DNA helicase, partial [Gemmatimonadetes bacterium]|nr:RecQ family ATP-dependent DNA helicase [Gemmatimonadota bacterium]